MDSEDSSHPLINPYVPAALLALSLCVFFFSQIKGAGQGASAMKWQNQNAAKQIATLQENRDKIAKAIEERKALVEQSEVTQKQFTDLMTEVDLLARGGDQDAKLIIEGYQIKVNDKPGATKEKSEKRTEGAEGGKETVSRHAAISLETEMETADAADSRGFSGRCPSGGSHPMGEQFASSKNIASPSSA